MPVLTGFPSCCGCDIISGFAQKPDAPIEFKKDPARTDRWGNAQYALDEKGMKIPLKTAREGLIELVGTKSSWGNHGGLPDRGFVCILAEFQLKKWMATLKELGFVFLFKWNNAVHEKSMNYMFGLAKHNSEKDIPPPMEPPEGWAELPEPDPEKVKGLYNTKPEYLNSEVLGDADGDLIDELDDYDDDFYEEDDEEPY